MSMVTAALRPSEVLVDETAIYDNVQHALTRLPKHTELFAVVKADGYGHGLLRTARVAQAAGATGFCVAVLDEALALRQAQFTEPILVLGIIEPAYAGIAAANHIAVPVGDRDWLTAASVVLTAAGTLPKLAVHFAIDSGMGRIGFRDAAMLAAAAEQIADSDQYTLEGVFTHFATADSPDDAYFKEQVAKFNDCLAVLPTRPRYVHVSNSATSLWHAACHGNMIRYGVAMYGLNPSGRAIPTTPYELEPALSVVSRLSFTKLLHAGDAVSYGATYHASGDEWIGTVPMGYADGWLRRLQGFHVLIEGQACEIVGRVCMDQFMVRMPEPFAVGTKVTLVGRSGAAAITLQDVADYADTIHYEIACNLTARLPRRSVRPLA